MDENRVDNQEEKTSEKSHASKIITSLVVILLVVTGVFLVSKFVTAKPIVYTSTNNNASVSDAEILIDTESGTQDNYSDIDIDKSVRHIETPKVVKGVYMTSWIAGSGDGKGNFPKREKIMDLIDETEINAVVIDLKDDTGEISFLVENPYLQEIGSATRRIPDFKNLINEFHDRGIYVIGRVAVFQDPYFSKLRPDLAVKTISTGEVWKDRRGLTWLDVGAEEVWDYVIAIAREAYNQGVDEIQFDYVRFPSDGNVLDSTYPFFTGKTKEVEKIVYEERIVNLDEPLPDGTTTKTELVPVTKIDTVAYTKQDQVREFFDYIGENLLGEIPISVDLFGYTTTNKDDLGIGQVIEDAMPNFDFISPMTYPSHYNQNAFGLGNPNDYPGEIIYKSLIKARERFLNAGHDPKMVRAWLQDFNYPVHYSAEDVREQINAVYSAGMDSWLLWDPANTYTKSALELDMDPALAEKTDI